MRLFSITALLVAIFVDQIYAQTTSVALSAASTYAPTNIWAPAAQCTAGSASPSGVGVMRGGVYRDEYVWLHWVELRKPADLNQIEATEATGRSAAITTGQVKSSTTGTDTRTPELMDKESLLASEAVRAESTA